MRHRVPGEMSFWMRGDRSSQCVKVLFSGAVVSTNGVASTLGLKSERFGSVEAVFGCGRHAALALLC
jgi:hypothetical protein